MFQVGSPMLHSPATSLLPLVNVSRGSQWIERLRLYNLALFWFCQQDGQRTIRTLFLVVTERRLYLHHVLQERQVAKQVRPNRL